MCGLTRLLLVGFVIGTVVSSVTGSELAGWLAALVGAAVVATVQRARGTAACAVQPPPPVTAEHRRDRP